MILVYLMKENICFDIDDKLYSLFDQMIYWHSNIKYDPIFLRWGRLKYI